MINSLADQKISVNVHFISMPMLSVFEDLGYDILNYPVAYDNFSSEISLPIYPQLTDTNLKRICLPVEKAYQNEETI